MGTKVAVMIAVPRALSMVLLLAGIALGLNLPAGTSAAGPGFDRMETGAASDRSRMSFLFGPRPTSIPVLTDSDLVVGAAPDTNETLVISGARTQHGRIIVLNRGLLILDHADLNLYGNVELYHSGRLTVHGGRFNVVQGYAYQYSAILTGNSELSLDSAEAEYNGQSWSITLVDSARLNIDNSVLRYGFTTVGMTGRCRVSYQQTDFASEFVVFDASVLRVRRSDTCLVWLGFPGGSSASLVLPEADTMLHHWEFPDSSASGIPYHVTLDSVTGVMWGTFPFPNSNVELRDSRIRATGLLFGGMDSIYLAGLVNNAHYQTWQLPVADRTFRLIDCFLQTWNLYPNDSVRFVLESSIFGELLASGRTQVQILGSLCDGSGGYIGAEAASQLLVVNSTVLTQFISRGRAVLFAGAANLNYWSPNATGASLMLLLFSTWQSEPIARDTAAIFISDFRLPPDAQTGALVPVLGTARILSGPVSPFRFRSYRMSWANPDSQQFWHPVGTVHDAQVDDDTLDIWDTRELAPGTYVLKMTLKDTLGDSLEPTTAVRLNPTGIEREPVPTAEPAEFVVRPAVSEGIVLVAGAKQAILLDAAGRPAARLNPGINDLRALPKGVYFAQALPENGTRTVKVILVK